MALQRFTNSRFGVGFALALARSLPPPLGYRVGRGLAGLIARFRNSTLVRAVRVNQWVVHGGRLQGEALEAQVRRVLRHGARCLYDLYHHLGHPHEVANLVHLDENLKRLVAQSRDPQPGRGVMVVGPHLSNFDLAMVALGYAGLVAQILSVATPTGGYAWQNRMRSVGDLTVTPVGVSTLAEAIERLRQGGVVATGVDRPVPGKRELLPFFGRSAPLPVGHVRIAMDAGVPIQVVACTFDEAAGVYRVTLSPPIPLQRTGDRRADIRANALRVLAVLEERIRQAPHQWLMYFPVWPDALEEVPWPGSS